MKLQAAADLAESLRALLAPAFAVGVVAPENASATSTSYVIQIDHSPLDKESN